MPKRSPRRRLVVSNPEEFGPAMLALNERQRAFVVAWVNAGGRGEGAECARLAGYSDNKEAAKVTAHRLLRNKDVIAAIHEEAKNVISSGALPAAIAIKEIAEDPSHRDRYKAAEAILNRTGMPQQAAINVTVTDSRTDRELLEAVRTLASKHGLDPAKLLGRSADVIEGEFEEVKADG